MGRVIIGMDPHKRSATIEVIDDREQVLARGRFGTDTDGYQAILKAGRRYKDRVWAIEGCNGIGRHIAQRLVADGETVLDVPAKLSARARVFATGQGRKTDPVDAHSVAVAAFRTKGLREVTVDDATVALQLLVDRRDGLGRARTDTINRLHRQLLELLPGGANALRTGLADAVQRWLPAWDGQLTPHGLRHFCASSLYASGVDLKAIQELLGHSWLSTTTRYIHVHESHIERVWVQSNQRVAARLAG